MLVQTETAVEGALPLDCVERLAAGEVEQRKGVFIRRSVKEIDATGQAVGRQPRDGHALGLSARKGFQNSAVVEERVQERVVCGRIVRRACNNDVDVTRRFVSSSIGTYDLKCWAWLWNAWWWNAWLLNAWWWNAWLWKSAVCERFGKHALVFINLGARNAGFDIIKVFESEFHICCKEFLVIAEVFNGANAAVHELLCFFGTNSIHSRELIQGVAAFPFEKLYLSRRLQLVEFGENRLSNVLEFIELVGVRNIFWMLYDGFGSTFVCFCAKWFPFASHDFGQFAQGLHELLVASHVWSRWWCLL